MILAKKIGLALSHIGMSEAKLSVKLGMSRQSLNRRIKTEKFTAEELERIAEAMGAEYTFGFKFPDDTVI